MSKKIAHAVAQLNGIKKGQQVTYFRGKNLSECNEDIRVAVRVLLFNERIRTHLKRVTRPMTDARTESTCNGVGIFDYIAIGR